MRGSLKLTLGIGLLSLVALGIPACGDDDEGGGGKSGSGGTGGTDSGSGGTAGSGGGTAGSGGGGTGGTGGGGVTCGGTQCQDYKVGGFLDLKGCCAGSAKDKCGGEVNVTISGLTGLPQGCYEVGQKGNDDTSCPPLKFTGLDGGPSQFEGCCNHATSKCGYIVNVSSLNGPDFGCVDSTGITDAPVSCTPKTGSDASTD